MAKYIHEGWSKGGDDIPQPTGIVLGGNLRRGAREDRRANTRERERMRLR
jgi:hypothetical protein